MNDADLTVPTAEEKSVMESLAEAIVEEEKPLTLAEAEQKLMDIAKQFMQAFMFVEQLCSDAGQLCLQVRQLLEKLETTNDNQETETNG